MKLSQIIWLVRCPVSLREKNNPSPKLTKNPIERHEEPPERPKANLNAALAAIEQKTLCNHATAKCRFLI